MPGYEIVSAILDELAAELPDAFFADLNGGVLLSHDVKEHPEALENGELYILGEYHHEPYGLGRYIIIYHGSLEIVCGRYSPPRFKAELRRVLRHEFTHHLESLAGERGLEIKDKRDLDEYKQRRGNDT